MKTALTLTLCCLLAILYCNAQEPLQMPSVSGGKNIYTHITADRNGNVFVAVERAVNGLGIYMHDGKKWWDMSMELPSFASITRIQAGKDALMVFGKSANDQPIIAVSYGRAWDTLPVSRLNGTVNGAAISTGDLIWLSGSFQNENDTAWLANWQNKKFHMKCGKPPKDEHLRTLFENGHEELYVMGNTDRIHLQVYDKSSGKRSYLSNIGNKWTLIQHNDQALSSVAPAIGTAGLFAVSDCDGIPGKCMVKWNNNQWTKIALNNYYKNHTINTLTFDAAGNLLAAGKTASAYGYEVLRYNGSGWHSFGDAISLPIGKMAYANGNVYVIPESRETIYMIPEVTSRYVAGPMSKDIYVKEVYDIVSRYSSSETPALERMNRLAQKVGEASDESDLNKKLSDAQGAVDDLQGLLIRTAQQLGRYKLKPGQNSLADVFIDRTTILITLTNHLEDLYTAIRNKNEGLANRYKNAGEAAAATFNTHNEKYQKALEEYRQRNGL